MSRLDLLVAGIAALGLAAITVVGLLDRADRRRCPFSNLTAGEDEL